MQQHHPDHNGGSPESARRFEEVQEAYAQITAERRRSPVRPSSPHPPPTDPDVEQRLANLERDIRKAASAARERAERAAREARDARGNYKRPSDEELGYIKTDDTLAKILADARKEFSERIGEVKDEPVTHRAADLLDDLAAWLKPDHGSGDERKSR